jgi:5'-nucleotidase
LTIMKLLQRLHLVLAAFVLSASARAGVPIDIHLVALNDFHGNLEESKFSYMGAGQKPVTLQAGGIDTIAAALQAWRHEDPELLLVGAGDLVGASPALSSMWADEPSIAAMNLLGLSASAVGNHEFDHGSAELLRYQHGGCQSQWVDKACKLAPKFDGARFSYLAANVVDGATGKPLLPAYRIVQAHGVKVAFIGAVLKDAASVVLASGIAGLRFGDEADAINATLPELKAQGATVFVVLIHEGGRTFDAFDQPGCDHLKGPIVDVVKRLDPAIRLVVSGHSHQGYLCKVDGRVVTQAEMAGHVLSRIDLTVDADTRAVRDIGVRNEVMRAGQYPASDAALAFMKTVRERSVQALARPVARVAVRTVSRKINAAGEAALGDLIADGALAATEAQGVQIAFMNMGGIRKDLDVGEDLRATYGQAQAVLPFSNTLVTMDLSGAQLRALLEQQWQRGLEGDDHSMLQVSHGFAYRWDHASPKGQRVLGMTLGGVPIEDAKTYRVAANNFLAEGGDSFSMFRNAANKVDTQILDLDALVAHLVQRDRAGAPAGSMTPVERVERLH